MKKKVFIGSSSESANIAEKIKVHLQQEYDCIIWNDNFSNRIIVPMMTYKRSQFTSILQYLLVVKMTL